MEWANESKPAVAKSEAQVIVLFDFLFKKNFNFFFLSDSIALTPL